MKTRARGQRGGWKEGGVVASMTLIRRLALDDGVEGGGGGWGMVVVASTKIIH